MSVDWSGKQWRQRPLAERLMPAWLYAVMALVVLLAGITLWWGLFGDETPASRARPVAVLMWVLGVVSAGLAVLSHRVRGRRP